MIFTYHRLRGLASWISTPICFNKTQSKSPNDTSSMFKQKLIYMIHYIHYLTDGIDMTPFAFLFHNELDSFKVSSCFTFQFLTKNRRLKISRDVTIPAPALRAKCHGDVRAALRKSTPTKKCLCFIYVVKMKIKGGTSYPPT